MRIGDEPVARFGACSLCGSWESVRELRNAKPGGRRNLYDSIISGRSDANIPFEQTVNMLKYLGFDERIRGSHHDFVREGIEEMIDIQNVGGECKPYQVKQMRAVLKKYNLRKEL